MLVTMDMSYSVPIIRY